MRLKIFMLAFITSASSLVVAQNAKRGVYLTADSFYRQQLAYAPVDGTNYRLKLHDMFYRPYITVVRGDSTVTLAKAAIFGYKDEVATNYRFFNKEVFEVQNVDSSLMLYVQKNYHGGKPVQVEITYYFSHGSKPPVRLTKRAIAKAFSDDAAFIEQVYDRFETDAALTTYDEYHRMFKLNSLYQKCHAQLP